MRKRAGAPKKVSILFLLFLSTHVGIRILAATSHNGLVDLAERGLGRNPPALPKLDALLCIFIFHSRANQREKQRGGRDRTRPGVMTFDAQLLGVARSRLERSSWRVGTAQLKLI